MGAGAGTGKGMHGMHATDWRALARAARDALVFERSGRVSSYEVSSASGRIRFRRRRPFTPPEAWDDHAPWAAGFEPEEGPPVERVRYTDHRGDSAREALVTWTRPGPRARGRPGPRRTAVVYVHGNAWDLGTLHRPFRYRPGSWDPAPGPRAGGAAAGRVRSLAQLVADAAGLPVAAVEFPGYGPEQGVRRVSEEDAVRAVQAVCERAVAAGGAFDRLLLYGYSIGAGLAAATLKRMGVGRARPGSPAAARVCGLVMESAFTSAFATTRTPAAQRLLLRAARLRMLENRATLPKLGGLPVAFIHGDADALCPLAQARELFAAARNCVGVLVAEGRDHNDVPTHPGYAPFLAAAVRRAAAAAVKGAAR